MLEDVLAFSGGLIAPTAGTILHLDITAMRKTMERKEKRQESITTTFIPERRVKVC